jgi:hypothetical protein
MQQIYISHYQDVSLCIHHSVGNDLDIQSVHYKST